MKYRLSILAMLCTAAIAVVLFFRTSVESLVKIEEGVASGDIRSAPGPRAAEVLAPPAARAEQASPVSQVHSISGEFKRATDYLDFANSILERAKNGDADAQYYLYAVLQYCDESYRVFFRKPKGGTRLLDEALNRASMRPTERVDDVRRAHARCSRIFDGGSQSLGTFGSWLALATKNGQPLALLVSARSLLINRKLSSENDTSARPEDTASAATDMVLKALRSKDPEVLWKIGEVQALLDGDGHERTLQSWAWTLVACQRGYDCENSPWMEFSCRFDQLCAQDKNAVDFIRRTTELDFPDIESRAKVINANIDAEAWDALEREITNLE